MYVSMHATCVNSKDNAKSNDSGLIFVISPSHAAIKISINATAAEFICKNIFPTPVQVKKKIKK